MANAEIYGKHQNSRYPWIPWIRNLGLALTLTEVKQSAEVQYNYSTTTITYPVTQEILLYCSSPHKHNTTVIQVFYNCC